MAALWDMDTLTILNLRMVRLTLERWRNLPKVTSLLSGQIASLKMMLECLLWNSTLLGNGWKAKPQRRRASMREESNSVQLARGQLAECWPPFQPRQMSEWGPFAVLLEVVARKECFQGEPMKHEDRCEGCMLWWWSGGVPFVCRGKVGRAARVAWKDESLGSRARPCGAAHSLGERRPEALALHTNDKDERPGNWQPPWSQVDTCFTSSVSAPAQAQMGVEEG